jgi:hypothetical protein
MATPDDRAAVSARIEPRPDAVGNGNDERAMARDQFTDALVSQFGLK